MAFRQGVVQPTTRPRFVPRRFSFGFVVRTLTLTTVTFSLAYSSSIAALIWILLASGWTANVYLLPAPGLRSASVETSIDFSLITGRRTTSAADRALTRTPPPSGPARAAR